MSYIAVLCCEGQRAGNSCKLCFGSMALAEKRSIDDCVHLIMQATEPEAKCDDRYDLGDCPQQDFHAANTVD